MTNTANEQASTAPTAVSPLAISRELSYSYDLLYDIKTPEQLRAEVESLASRLSGIAELCRGDGFPIDDYIKSVLAFPDAATQSLGAKAPISETARRRLQRDAADLSAAAARKQISLHPFELSKERLAAQTNFELGCWLHYYSRRVGMPTEKGFEARVDCLRRLIMADQIRPGYDYFTVFDFGERQYDAIFEMCDTERVIDKLREMIPQDKTGRIEEAFRHFGWPIENTTQGELYERGTSDVSASRERCV